MVDEQERVPPKNAISQSKVSLPHITTPSPANPNLPHSIFLRPPLLATISPRHPLTAVRLQRHVREDQIRQHGDSTGRSGAEDDV